MTLYVVLNNDGTLAVEHESSGSRETIISDDSGPTLWETNPTTQVPRRVDDLVRQWVQDAVSGSQPATGKIIQVMIDYNTNNIVDDR